QAVDIEHDARLLQVEQILVERERCLADATDDFLFAEPAAARRQRQPDGALPADVHHKVVLDALGDLAPAGRTSGALYCSALVAYARALLTMHHAEANPVSGQILEARVDDALFAHSRILGGLCVLRLARNPDRRTPAQCRRHRRGPS